MQFLLFSLGNDRYGLDTCRVLRVLPRLDLKEIPGTPAWVAGLMNYHGEPVPVIDISMLALGVPASMDFDTRIIVVDYRAEGGIRHTLGLIAEQASDIRHFDAASFVSPGIDTSGAPYLAQVSAGTGGMIQLVKVDDLLPDEVRAQLFPIDTELVP